MQATEELACGKRASRSFAAAQLVLVKLGYVVVRTADRMDCSVLDVPEQEMEMVVECLYDWKTLCRHCRKAVDAVLMDLLVCVRNESVAEELILVVELAPEVVIPKSVSCSYSKLERG